MKKIEFSAVRWLEDLRFSGDKKELVANSVIPQNIKVTVNFNDSSFCWESLISKFFKFGATPGTEIVVKLEDVNSSVSRTMVVPGKQYVRMSSNSVSGTRKKMLNNIFAGREIQSELMPFVKFLRDGKFRTSIEEESALNFIKSSDDLSTLAFGIFLVGLYENRESLNPNIKNCVIEFCATCFERLADLNLFELSLLSLASNLKFMSEEKQVAKLNSYIEQQLSLLESSQDDLFSIEQFVALINLCEYSCNDSIKSIADKLVNERLKKLAILSFDGVSFVLDSDQPARQIVSLHKGHAQSVMSCFVPGVPLVYNPWNIFIVLSSFEPSFDLVGEVFALREQTYKNTKIHKTTAYLLASICHKKQGLFGMAALNKTCTVFSSYYDFYADDFCDVKQLKAPKISLVDSFIKIIYTMEALKSKKSMLYWPQDEFERQYIEGNWVFAEVSQGRIAVHCSCKIVEYNDVLINKELEASGNEVVWTVVCADKKEDCSLTKFSERIKNNGYFKKLND
jgi:hypothetical protein